MTSNAFQRLKPICVPLLASSELTPSSIPVVLRSLNDLHACLVSIVNDADDTLAANTPPLNQSLIGYVFFPISTILRRNSSAAIPDQVLEAILRVLSVLIDAWWWDCELQVWEQVLVLCGAIVGGIDVAGGVGKGSAPNRVRADETKTAAALCLLSLLRERTHVEAQARGQSSGVPAERLSELQLHCLSTPKLTPLIGQTISSLLLTAQSIHVPLQNASLSILRLLVRVYASDSLVPGVLPGIVSAMTRVVLGAGRSTGWARAEAIEGALGVMQDAIIQAIGDEVCIRDGAVRAIDSLDDFASFAPSPSSSKSGQHTSSHTEPSSLENRFTTEKTPSWLNGTSTQLHIALNTLTPLLSHPTPSAQRALSNFACELLISTTLTLPQSQPLLLTFLLSLAGSETPAVHQHARERLSGLFSDKSTIGKGSGKRSQARNRRAQAQHSLMQTLLCITRDTLASIPRLVVSQADAKVTHAASLITAVCGLASAPSSSTLTRSISAGVGALLGPAGGIEKWGHTLLSVLEFSEPQIGIFTAPDPAADPLLLLSGTAGQSTSTASGPDVAFPALQIRSLTSTTALSSIAYMLRALGRTAPDECLFAVEWFTGVGAMSLSSRGTTGSRHSVTPPAKAVAALWCACRLLEGASSGVVLLVEGMPSEGGDVSTTEGALQRPANKRLEKLARTIAKKVAALWDEPSIFTEGIDVPKAFSKDVPNSDVEPLVVEHVKGVVPLHSTLQLLHSAPASASTATDHPQALHPAVLLHLLTLCLSILFTSSSSSSRTQPLLLHTLYPVLHALVCPLPFLSATARAALAHIAHAAAYASVPNMLYANFDYALGGVARRLDARGAAVYGMYDYGEGGAVGAARVLRVLVRLVGGAIVARAGDVVEACFERLEELHGYDVLVDALVGVLGDVVDVLRVDAEAEDEVDEVDGTRQTREGGIAQYGASALLEWMKHRHDNDVERDDTDYGPAPREAWGTKKEEDEEDKGEDGTNPKQEPEDPPPTATQALTSQIILRSVHLLTHPSPVIRARILGLLTSSVPVLHSHSSSDANAETPGWGFHSSATTLLPAVNSAWPFILNRLADPAPFVVAAAVGLVAALSTHIGEFMHRRVWDDVWPRFKRILADLDAADAQSALARRQRRAPPPHSRSGPGLEFDTGTGVGTASAYTHSHRLYRAMLQTLTAALEGGVPPQDSALWEVMLAVRRFLSADAHLELQACARRFYIALAQNNADAVWLVLIGTCNSPQLNGFSMGEEALGDEFTDRLKTLAFMKDRWGWGIEENVQTILIHPNVA
ncbi:hypothetical protein HGRIS_004484 [Hohenbuehelia grisea]|uniref:Uncharacterized protein n=1 Tax=Hohenbuehelia grisea TaxID=104357 RepID=A0ABR3JD84_9AGAR